VTVHYLRKQIKQAQSHRADDIALNHTVARALSINATSEFMKSCEEFSNYFEETLGEWRKENISEYSEEQVSFKSFKAKNPPSLNVEYCAVLAKLIHGASSPTKDKEFLADFISRIQIYNSRSQSFKNSLESQSTGVYETQFFEKMIEALILYNFALVVLKYGRDMEIKHIPNLPDEINIGFLFSSNFLYNEAFNEKLKRVVWPPKPISHRQREMKPPTASNSE